MTQADLILFSESILIVHSCVSTPFFFLPFSSGISRNSCSFKTLAENHAEMFLFFVKVMILIDGVSNIFSMFYGP